MKSDLTIFASVENGVLTCALHGWQYDLETGRCLTSEGHEITARKLTEDELEALVVAAAAAGAEVAVAAAD